jgi:hypothetical protein
MTVEPDPLLEEIDPGVLSADERQEIERLLLAKTRLWEPLPGPQESAYHSKADVVGFGGAAGGGKSELAIGLSLTEHRRIGFFRQTGTELTAVIDRIEEIVGTRKGYSGTDRIWRMEQNKRKVQIEFGSFPDAGDERKYRGRPHDLLVFDEAQDMREEAVRFLMAWMRTTDPKQRCRALMTFNPPTSVEGRWVISYFAPWIDKRHPNPAKPGEIRWYVSIDGAEKEVDGPEIVEHGDEKLVPQSRTFIPSRVTDNPFLMGTGYEATLQSIKDDRIRAQLLHGDFQAGLEDDAFQVIPTAWIEAAMERWQHRDVKTEMESLGVDVALGGRDNTIIARRHEGMWFDEPIVYPGTLCVDGETVAAFVMAAMRDQAVIHLDLFGVGARPYGVLNRLGMQVIGVNVGEPAPGVDASGRVGFFNLRSMIWWKMREALDPSANNGIALPPDNSLLADLAAPCWEMRGQKIKVESRDEMIKKIGRSPDYGSAYCLGLLDTPKMSKMAALGQRKEWDPFKNI